MTKATNYYRWIMSHFLPHLGRRVVEVGAGIGTFSEFLVREGRVQEVILIEPADRLFELLAGRFADRPGIRLIHGYLDERSDDIVADTVVMVNVLEHIDDDGAALRAAHRILTPGGRILILTPAMPGLFGTLDEAFGHVRRYAVASLRAKIEQSRFEILTLRHFNLPGIISWFLAGRVLQRKTLSSRNVSLYDRWVVPWASRLERRWSPPLGQSLIAVARKQTGIRSEVVR